MSNEQIEQLKARGFRLQFTASGKKLADAIEEYRALGFDVRTIPVKDLAGDGCSVCFDDENDRTEMIFTKKVSASLDDGLYDVNDG